MRNPIPLVLCLCAIGLAFSLGCFSFEKSYPEKRFFVLDTARSEVLKSPAEGPVLRLRKLTISPQYDGKSFVYRRDELCLESDYYNEFFIDTADILGSELKEWLEGAGLFSLVTGSTSHVEAACTLTGNVPALYGDFRDEDAPKAVLEIQFLLLSDASSRADIIFQKDYRREIGLPDPSATALARGWNKGLEEIFIALEADLQNLY